MATTLELMIGSFLVDLMSNPTRGPVHTIWPPRSTEDHMAIDGRNDSQISGWPIGLRRSRTHFLYVTSLEHKHGLSCIRLSL